MFRFKIGDFVVFKSAVAVFRRFPDLVPQIFTVTQQVSQTCPSGTQYKYTLGNMDGTCLDHELADLAELDAAILWVETDGHGSRGHADHQGD